MKKFKKIENEFFICEECKKKKYKYILILDKDYSNLKF